MGGVLMLLHTHGNDFCFIVVPSRTLRMMSAVLVCICKFDLCTTIPNSPPFLGWPLGGSAMQ